MAAPQPPQLTLFPDPPLLTDDEDTYNARADDTVIAQQKFIPEINYALTWIGDQVLAVDGYRQAAATSATNAASSATAANASKTAAAQSALDATNNGKAQVDLAKAQVTAAQQAAAAAQSAAQAAGAAAGLPGGRVPFTVLQINAAGNVAWTDGLIDKTNALPGQALMLGTGKTPQWGFLGQQIGDVLQTCRDPGALYLPANGSIRLQSAYPALFAKLGLIGGSVGTNWADYDYGAAGATDIGASISGTVIAILGPTQIRRSSDRGLTWANITLPAVTSNQVFISQTDNLGTWILSCGDRQCLRSTDDGLTWQVVTMPLLTGGGFWFKHIYCGNGIWLAISNYSTTIARSVDGGVSWTTVSHGYPQGNIVAIGTNGLGTVLITGYDGTNSTLRKSTNYGASFSSFITLTAQAYSIGCDSLGNWAVGQSGATNLRSYDDASSFSQVTVTGGTANAQDVSFINGSLYFLFAGSGTRIITINPNGSITPQASSSNVSSNGRLTNAGNGVIFARSVTANRISRSVPQFGYDTATQFALPNVQTVIGLSAFIKAKELA
jgi:hypothetical protein